MARARHPESGSALITVVFISAAIGLLLVGVSHFSTTEVRNASALEDSTIAYSAAEAGIEDGLLRWRFNHNVELPQTNMQESITNATRVYLGTTKPAQTVSLGAAGIDPSLSTYDVRMWYKVPALGSPVASQLLSPAYQYRLRKDDTLDIDVSGLRGQKLVFTYQVPGNFQTQIEYRILAADPANPGSFTELCSQCKPPLTDAAKSGTLTILVPPGTDSQAYRLRIKPFLFNIGTQTPAPSDSFITYALTPVTTGSLVDSGTTLIESTGYYGAAKRKLIAKLDRRSGTVLGVYDYAVFTKDQIGI